MSTSDILRDKQEQLDESFRVNLESTRRLQRTMSDILPGLADELGLDDEAEERAALWLSDLHSLFRILRRHRFTLSFALENAWDVLLWRLAVIPPQIPRPTSPYVHCLPLSAVDPFGRPIIVLKLSRLLSSTQDTRQTLIHYVELLRMNLEAVNAETGDNHNHAQERPVLQYVALVDIGGLSVQNAQSVDLVTWFIYELLPRFPGMLAAVFVLNYSWAHSGVWNILKRVLPKSALSRVFFPSRDELLAYFSPSSIPRDYGGSLSPLSDVEDPLEGFYAHNNPMHIATLSEEPNMTDSANGPLDSADQSCPPPRVPSISPTSHLNPYFGYPVSGRGAPTPRLRYGRQRKRDLLRTLATLWWSRWKHRVLLLVCVLFAIVSYRLRRAGYSRMLLLRQSVRGLLLHPPARPRP